MPILYESYAPQVRRVLEEAERIIFENRFDAYFAPMLANVVSWKEPGLVHVSIPHTSVAYGHYRSHDVKMTGLGTTTPDWSIPDTFLEPVTYTFRWRVLPEERFVEALSTHIMWYGSRFYDDWFGWLGYPLFRIYLDARDNHLYLVFDGSFRPTLSPATPTYPFGSWKVDLGHVDKFIPWTNFTVWMDLENRVFKKMFIGGREIPWPPGYEEGIHPQVSWYRDFMLNGMMAGIYPFTGRTNVTWEFDDVEVWAGYHTPPGVPPGVPSEICWGNLAVIGFISGVTLGWAMSLRRKER